MTHFLSIVHLAVMVADATPLPIDVQHLPPPDWFAGLTLLVSVILAGVTGFLFLATRNMAKETKRLADKTAEMAMRTAELAADTVSATDQDDRHHQQSLWPMVVARWADLVGESGAPLLAVNCKNIGTGTCVTGGIRITALNLRDASATPMGTWVPSCGTGEEIDDLRIPLAAAGVRSHADVDNIVFVIDYQTMFGSVGRTNWSLKRDQNGKMTLGALLPFEHPEVIVPAPKRQQ